MINDSDLCTGCSLCYAICPREAISMERNNEGFLYPKIDSSKCIKCNKCSTNCPQLKKEKKTDLSSTFYYAHADKKMRSKGSSGGIFSSIAEHLLDKGYSVYAATFNDCFSLKHDKVMSKDELEKFRYSKYIQSDIRNIYKDIKNDLFNKRKVLFIGTPCQVDAIKHFTDYSDLLFTMDLVCYGVGSNAIFDDFLHKKEKEYKSNASKIIFRKKILGEAEGFMTILFANKKKYKKLFFNTEFGMPFCNRLISRKSCYKCKYSSFERTGDITLGDYRRSNTIACSPRALKKGISLIRTNTTKGKAILNELILEKKVFAEKVDYSALKDNLVRQSEESIDTENRDKAMNIYTKEGYESFIKNYYTFDCKKYFERRLSYLKSNIKWLLFKLRIRDK